MITFVFEIVGSRDGAGPDVMNIEINDLITQQKSVLLNLAETAEGAAQFEGAKQVLIESLIRAGKYTNLRDKAAEYMREVFSPDTDFLKTEKKVAAVEAVNVQDMVEFYDYYITGDTRRAGHGGVLRLLHYRRHSPCRTWWSSTITTLQETWWSSTITTLQETWWSSTITTLQETLAVQDMVEFYDYYITGDMVEFYDYYITGDMVEFYDYYITGDTRRAGHGGVLQLLHYRRHGGVLRLLHYRRHGGVLRLLHYRRHGGVLRLLHYRRHGGVLRLLHYRRHAPCLLSSGLQQSIP